ncbi:MAG: PKD domain-containing protein [Candidatus Geothermarchaeales archaeon]
MKENREKFSTGRTRAGVIIVILLVLTLFVDSSPGVLLYTFGQQTLTLQTEKDTYYPDEKLIVFGTTSPFVAGAVQVYDPEGEMAAVGQFTSDADGNFRVEILTFPSEPNERFPLGVYTIKAYAAGETAELTITFTLAVNQPPTADADGPYEGVVGEALTFDGSASTDPDGNIVSYGWDFGDGAAGTGVNPTHTYTSPGTYTVKLTVMDDRGATASDETKATISPPPNKPPEADFTYTPTEPTTADTVEFTDASNDPDGSIVSWLWDFGDGSTSTDQNPKHRYGDDGAYTVKLTVTDDDGASDAVSKQVNVLNIEPDASFAYSPEKPTDLDDVKFMDQSNDPDGAIASWLWDFGDGSTSTDQNPTHKYADDGAYTAVLKVTDDDGASSTYSKTITVTNVPPIAEFTYSPEKPTSQDDIQFVDKSSDPDGNIASYEWDFGDGTISTEQNPKHRFRKDGTYTVKLTVTDDDGASHEVSRDATIAPPPPPTPTPTPTPTPKPPSMAEYLPYIIAVVVVVLVIIAALYMMKKRRAEEAKEEGEEETGGVE